MYRSRNRRSTPMLLPQRGAVPATGTCLRTYSSTCACASSTVTSDFSIAGEQRRLGVHVPNEVVHPAERVFVGVDDEVDAVVERREVRVGDDARDLDDHVLFHVEPGHLQVDPHERCVFRS